MPNTNTSLKDVETDAKKRSIMAKVVQECAEPEKDLKCPKKLHQNQMFFSEIEKIIGKEFKDEISTQDGGN